MKHQECRISYNGISHMNRLRSLSVWSYFDLTSIYSDLGPINKITVEAIGSIAHRNTERKWMQTMGRKHIDALRWKIWRIKLCIG